MTKKISIKGPYASENLGDYAMLISTLKILNKMGNFEYNIYTKTIDKLMPSLKDEFKDIKNINLIPSKFNFLKGILKSKLVLYGGGSQIVKKRTPFPLLLTVAVSKLFRKKILIYSVDGSYLSFLYKLAIKWSDGIIFRVPEHYNKCKKINKNTYLLPDIAVLYFFDIINMPNIKKNRNKKYLCHSKCFFNKNLFYKKNKFESIQQETPYKLLTKDYFKNLYINAKEVVSFHYHTLLFCHLANIKSTSLQDKTKKHESINKFKDNDYKNTEKNYRSIFRHFLNKLKENKEK